MISRRHLLQSAGAAGAAALLPAIARAQSAASMLSPGVPDGIASYVTMGKLPGKQPLIQLADRPPNYEAPLEYLRTPITPNDKFFVRYHLADIPEVKVAFTLAAKKIGPLPVAPDHVTTGHWAANGVQIPMAGDWKVAVTVRTSDIDQVTVSKNAQIG